MPDIDSIVGRTFGPAIVGVKIDGDSSCYDLGCINSFRFTEAVQTRDLFCDVRDGPIGFQQFDPRGTLEIEALQVTADNLQIATFGTQSSYPGFETTTCEKQDINWTGGSGSWTASVQLNHGYISGSIDTSDIYIDSDCATAFDQAADSSSVTVAAACAGFVQITSEGGTEPSDVMYFDYTHDFDIPSGSVKILPSYPSTPAYYELWVDHYMADSDKVYRFIFWRAQLVRNFNMQFTNTDGDILVPMTFQIFKDSEFDTLYTIYEIADEDDFTPGHPPSNT